MRKKYYIRLDDACPTMDFDKWNTIVSFLLSLNIKPLIGVIPNNEDSKLLFNKIDIYFWDLIKDWEQKGCVIAQHGYNHVYITKEGGLNPIQRRSEFAGVKYSLQKTKIIEGYEILKNKNLNVNCFFAPSHTYDLNTLKIIKKYTPIRFISDTLALKPYSYMGLTFYPVLGEKIRCFMPGDYTIALHPSAMSDNKILDFKNSVVRNKLNIYSFELLPATKGKSIFDNIYSGFYFMARKLRKL